MTPSGLKGLTIEHLRGSTLPFTLGFEKDRKLTVVYGENATGKSTIADAIEFLGKGTVGSLKDRGLGATPRYWHSVGRSASDVSVTLEYRDQKSCRATVLKGEVVAKPAECRPRVEVLRRVDILNLLTATPAKRYEAISRFIDVSGIEASEAMLRNLIRDLERNREVAVAQITENETAITQYWESAKSPGPDALSWAKAETKRDPDSEAADVDGLDQLRLQFARLSELPALQRQAESAVERCADDVALAEKNLAASAERGAVNDVDLLRVLESAAALLVRHPDPKECPVCESPEKAKDLAKRVTARLHAFSVLKEAQEVAAAARATLMKANTQLVSQNEVVIRESKAFQTLSDSRKWPTDIPLPKPPPPRALEIEAWMDDLAGLPALWKEAATRRSEAKQFRTALAAALSTYQSNLRAQKELDVLLPRLKRTLDVVADERRTFTDAILTKIAAEVGRMYEVVHPGEGLAKITLDLDPKKRASLDIGTSFYGAPAAPPQAYFSDSHLDTLGLCVFLAIAALDKRDETILVLDDVLASVDEPHVDRLIEMLYAEATGFRHCVITTHYRPWKEKLRWGWLKTGECQFIELAKWSNAKGMSVIRSIPDVERLRGLLTETPPDPQLICAKAGVILEAALDFLTMQYGCAVPRRRGDTFTLGDLLPAVGSKLRKALEVEVLGTDASGAKVYTNVSLGPMLDEIAQIAQTRNVFGCHFNALSFDLLDTDAIGFGRRVLDLIDALADPEAGWPGSAKSGKYWANSGETRRLHPLQKPS